MLKVTCTSWWWAIADNRSRSRNNSAFLETIIVAWRASHSTSSRLRDAELPLTGLITIGHSR